MQSIKLYDGSSIPILGLEERTKTFKAVLDALNCGYTHIDTATIYCIEGQVGDAIQEWLKNPDNKREKLYITTKLWNNFHQREQVEPACRRSLELLKTDYIDMYLIHWPTAFVYNGTEVKLGMKHENLDYPLEETWKAMEELVAKGLVKSIGISNFNKKQVDRILAIAKIKPAVNQIESSISFPNQKLIDYCHSKDIKIMAYSPLVNPSVINEKPMIQSEMVKRMSEKYQKTPGQICLKFNVQRGLCTVPKSFNESRIKENLDLFNFEIAPEDMQELMGYEPKFRYINLKDYIGDHKEYPFQEEY